MVQRRARGRTHDASDRTGYRTWNMADEGTTGRGISSELGFAESFIVSTLDLTAVPACLARTEDLSLNRPPAGSPSRSQRFTVSKRVPPPPPPRLACATGREEFETWLPAGRAGEGSQVVSGSFSNFKTCAHVGQADMGRSRPAPCWLARQVPTFYC